MTTKYKTKTDVALEAIRNAILGGEIRPGERIIVSNLSKKLGMSSTPIREALLILGSEGLLDSKPHQGVTVYDLNENEADEIWMLRALLEAEATKIACPRLTHEDLDTLLDLEQEMKQAFKNGENGSLTQANANWHFTIYYASDKKYLVEFIERLWALFPWETIYLVPDRTEKSFFQHNKIRKVLESKDPDSASQLMKDHILSGRESVINHLRSLKPNDSQKEK